MGVARVSQGRREREGLVGALGSAAASICENRDRKMGWSGFVRHGLGFKVGLAIQ